MSSNPAQAFWAQFSKDAPSLTHQSFKDECDINNIIARCVRTGFLVDPMTPRTAQPLFGDFGSAVDFQEAQNLFVQAKSRFDSLPSSLRDRFANDPVNLLSFLENPSNREEAVRLGLVSPTSSPAPGIAPASEPGRSPQKASRGEE